MLRTGTVASVVNGGMTLDITSTDVVEALADGSKRVWWKLLKFPYVIRDTAKASSISILAVYRAIER